MTCSIDTAIQANLLNREVSPNNPIAKLFYLLPQYRIGAILGNTDTPAKVLHEVIMHCENISDHIFTTIQSLTKFLNVGIQDEDIGSIQQADTCRIIHHINLLSEFGHSIYGIEAIAREELSKT